MHTHAAGIVAPRATHPHTPQSRLRTHTPSVSLDTLGLASPLSLRAYDADMVSPIARHTLKPYVTPPALRDPTPTLAPCVSVLVCAALGVALGVELACACHLWP